MLELTELDVDPKIIKLDHISKSSMGYLYSCPKFFLDGLS